MTEHDTPSTARTEAVGRVVLTFQSEEDAAIALMQRARDDARRQVLAQVREGLEALERELLAPVPRYGAFRRSVIELRNEGVCLALAVVDRLEGNTK